MKKCQGDFFSIFSERILETWKLKTVLYFFGISVLCWVMLGYFCRVSTQFTCPAAWRNQKVWKFTSNIVQLQRRDMSRRAFQIDTEWDSSALPAANVVNLTVSSSKDVPDSISLHVQAPYFNDPPPPAATGMACDQLWDYEVVEAFFLGDDDKYLEVELCPHGQHLVLLLQGVRNMRTHMLPLEFAASINEARNSWTGEARIPLSYFPPTVTRFNAYAIHGSGAGRTYSSLYPAPKGAHEQPDFHRLQYFKPFDFSAICQHPIPAASGKSSFW